MRPGSRRRPPHRSPEGYTSAGSPPFLGEAQRGAPGHYLAPDAGSRCEARSCPPRPNCHGGRSEEACVRSDRFPSSYPTRLLGKRVFLFHGDAAVILARHLVADARHLVEITRVLERTVCFS